MTDTRADCKRAGFRAIQSRNILKLAMLSGGCSDQLAKAQRFRQLHQRDSAFIIPNPWEIGTARLLTHLGFEALATTSMGYAFSRGRRDNTLSRDETLAHASEIVAAGKRRPRERLWRFARVCR